MGQAFDVCHQLILQQKSEDKENEDEQEEEGKVEESEAVPGCSSTHTHTSLLPEQKHWEQNSSLLSCCPVSNQEVGADRGRP